jgi:hypothetical protein
VNLRQLQALISEALKEPDEGIAVVDKDAVGKELVRVLNKQIVDGPLAA